MRTSSSSVAYADAEHRPGDYETCNVIEEALTTSERSAGNREAAEAASEIPRSAGKSGRFSGRRH